MDELIFFDPAPKSVDVVYSQNAPSDYQMSEKAKKQYRLLMDILDLCEIYHLIFDAVSFSHVIETETIMEERKAEYFASLMLFGNLLPYYTELSDMEFLPKVFHCMDAFRAPFKAVLIALYESAVLNENHTLMRLIKENFDNSFIDLADRFRELGLDDSLVKASYVVNVGTLQAKIQERIKKNPELNYNYDNASFLKSIVREINYQIEDSRYP